MQCFEIDDICVSLHLLRYYQILMQSKKFDYSYKF
jgi:hypothetical protein